MKNKNYLIGIAIVVVLVFLDLLSKYVIDRNFELSESLIIIDNFFSLTYAHNYGAAFSIFDGNRVFLILSSLGGTVLFGYLFRKINFKTDKIYSISICLMLAGTLGNFYDRLFLGYVRDMFDFIIFGYDFAIFNVADSLLVVGMIVFIILGLTRDFLRGD